MSELREIAEKHAVEEWSLIEEESKLKLGALKLSEFKFETLEINKAELKAGMKIAISNEPNGNGYGSQHGGTST